MLRSVAVVASAVVAAGVLAAPVPASADDPAARVVGGKPAADGAYPWMAHLSMGCGGSLVSKDIVVSAAHCFEGGSGRVTLHIGKNRWRDGVKRTGRAKWGGTAEDRDWAVVKLDNAWPAPVFAALPTDGRLDASPVFRVMGWGATREGGPVSANLMEVDVPLVPEAQCRRVVVGQEICAGDLSNGGIDTCQGDSGGPLAVQEAGRWVVVGLTSWGIGCARPNEPGHYAKVSAFIPQMKAAIRSLKGTMPAGW